MEQVAFLEDRLLGLLALQELADLVADRRQHPEQVLVGLLDLTAKGLHDPQDVAIDDDREAERAVQPRASRRGRSREVWVLDDVWDPRGLAARPDAAGQSVSGGERGPPTQGRELTDPRRRRVPQVAVP